MLFRICIGPRRLMPPTSAPGFRMEKAIVGVAHRVLFGALSFAAPEEQAFNGEITDRMCSKSPAEVRSRPGRGTSPARGVP
jgi:hypothetical protein